jgi:uncharacterized integral membrane protein
VELCIANILPALFWMVALSLAAWRLPFFGKNETQRKWFFGLFGLKILVGMAVWAIYTFYYTDRQTSDIYRFFADSEVVYHTLFNQPKHYFQLVTGIGGNATEHQPYFEAMNNWYKSFDDGFLNENRTLIRINALLIPLTLGSYFGNMVIICFLGVWAQSFLFRQLVKRYEGIPLLLFAAINLWPSQLFWTSALMKEPLVMIGIAVSLGAALMLKKKISAPIFLLLVTGIWLTLFSKFYIGIALCFPLLAFLLDKEVLSIRKSFMNYGIALGMLLLSAWGIGKLIPQFDIPMIISAKQQAFNNVANATKAGSAFYITKLEPNLQSMLRLAPEGLRNSLLRPYPKGAGGMMEWAAVAENLLFISVLSFLLIKINLKNANFSLTFSLLLFGLIILVLGGITVNISGALVRYKMPAIPYLTLALLMVSKLNNVKFTNGVE